MVIKADELTRMLDDQFDKESPVVIVSSLVKLISTETLRQIAESIVACHKPVAVNYYERFEVAPNSTKQRVSPDFVTSPKIEKREPTSEYYCFKCRKVISQRVARFCFDNKQRFGGKAYCYDCQKSF